MPEFLNSTRLNWGGKTGFFWGGCCALCAVWSYFRLPEPKGRTYGSSALSLSFSPSIHTDPPSSPPLTGELDVLFGARISARKFKYTQADQFASHGGVTHTSSAGGEYDAEKNEKGSTRMVEHAAHREL
jgi:SP family general alpha glucoside:H+ symporter-like MFS transporter